VSERLPTVRGLRESVLTRPDFEMMVLLSTGQVTESEGRLYMRGYVLSAIAPETIHIRQLLSKGVVAVIGGSVVPTPEASKLLAATAEKYGYPLKKVQRDVKKIDVVQAVQEHERRRR
jgi:hypothetical protein